MLCSTQVKLKGPLTKQMDPLKSQIWTPFRSFCGTAIKLICEYSIASKTSGKPSDTAMRPLALCSIRAWGGWYRPSKGAFQGGEDLRGYNKPRRHCHIRTPGLNSLHGQIIAAPSNRLERFWGKEKILAYLLIISAGNIIGCAVWPVWIGLLIQFCSSFRNIHIYNVFSPYLLLLETQNGTTSY